MPPEPNTLAASLPERVRVLHVDDDGDFTDVVAATLESRSDRIEVVTATSASEGLSRLADDIDCIVSDYDMPGADGIEFLRAVREERPSVPFVLFTGKGSEAVASEAVSAGVTDYLQKSGGTEQYELLAKKVIDAVETDRGRRARRRQLRAIETAQEGISILDDDWRFAYVNEAYADLYGYEPEEMIGEGWELIYPEDEAEFAREHVLPAVEERGYWHGETIGLRADGSRFVEDHTLSKTANGGLVCTVRDITDEKEREQDLIRKTRALDEAPIGVTLSDPRQEDNPLVYVNDHFEELTGYDESEALGRNCRFLQGEETDPVRIAQLREAIESQEQTQVDIRNYRAGGEAFWNRVTIAPIEDEGGDIINWVGFQQDVTEHHERVESLRRYRHIVNTMGESACLYDEDGRFVVINRNLADFYGAEPESLEGEPSTLVRMIREAADGDPYAELVASERDELRGEIEGEFPDRGYAVVDYRLSRLTADGEFAGVVAVARDITERKRREAELRETNALLEAVLESLPMGVLVEDADRKIRATNEALCDLFDASLSPEDLRGRDCAAAAEEMKGLFADSEGLLDGIEALLDRRERRLNEQLQLADGRILERDYVPYDHPEGAANLWIYRDVTDRTDRERQLRRENERLEEFASIVSHDLRNPLNVAESYLELARAECESDYLDDASRAHGRMEDLIDDLLALARSGEAVSDLEAVDVGEMAESCWRNVETDNARLRIEAERTIRANPSRLQQLLENLVRNSVEHGATNPSADDGVTVTVGDLDGGFYVADDGPGIPEGERERVFESGYSTSAEGTGFGLSIVAEIAEAHGWDVAVTESETGGARFEITGVEFV